MTIALAQLRPHVGAIEENIQRHLEFVSQAAARHADFIIFPELSLSGYEPKLADTLALELHDQRLDVFDTVSLTHSITIAVGIPLRVDQGVHISLVIFSPAKSRKVYSKHFLHPDETLYFIPGQNAGLQIAGSNIALAICYELSVEAHRSAAFASKPDLYITSVAKTRKGVAAAQQVLADTAMRYSTIALMCNSVGKQDGEDCAGTTSAWNQWGDLIGQLDALHEGVLFVESSTAHCEELYLSN